MKIVKEEYIMRFTFEMNTSERQTLLVILRQAQIDGNISNTPSVDKRQVIQDMLIGLGVKP